VAGRKVILAGQVAAVAAGVAMLARALRFGAPPLWAVVCFLVPMTA
jgi:DHA1 family bicyclomycin/chloramphenicol resistance-like MFS transporter